MKFNFDTLNWVYDICDEVCTSRKETSDTLKSIYVCRYIIYQQDVLSRFRQVRRYGTTIPSLLLTDQNLVVLVGKLFYLATYFHEI